VQGWVGGAYPNFGVMIRGPETAGPSSAWRAFSTREGDYAPQLVVTYGLPPAVMNDAPAEGEAAARRSGPALLSVIAGRDAGADGSGRVLQYMP